MNTTLNVGLIGAGRIGQVHAASIAADPGTALSWVADPDIAAASQLAARFDAKASADAEELLTSGELDAVLVASPTATHVDLISRCVDLGLPVLCEKPIDLDLRRVDGIREKIASSGVPVALGFNRRFDPSVASLRARALAGEVGQLEQLTIMSRDPAAPPAQYVAVSGGIFRDMTIHDFDMARFFLPDIVEVQATGSTLFDDGAREHGDYDTTVTVLRASTGAIVTIVNARHCAVGYDQRIEVFGAKGLLTLANAPTSLVSRSTAEGVETRPGYQDFFLERYAAAYACELAEFVKLVHGEPSTSATFEDGRAALVLADAAQRSATERVVVPVVIDPS